MAKPTPIRLAPPEALLQVLAERGFAVSPRENLKVRQLLGLRSHWPPRELASALAALLATNPSELERMRSALLGLFEQPDEPRDPTPQPEPGGSKSRQQTKSLDTWRRWWSWQGALAAAGLLTAVVVAALTLLPRPDARGDREGLSVDLGQSITIPVLDNDTAPFVGARTLAIVKQPLQGTAVESDGEIIFTASAEVPGTDHLVYELRHWSGTARALVELEVRKSLRTDETEIEIAPPTPGERTRLYLNVPHFAGEPVLRPRALPPLLPLFLPALVSGGALAVYGIYLLWSRRRRRRDPVEWDPRAPERFRPSLIGGLATPWLSPRELDQLAEVPIVLDTDEASDRLDLAATVVRSTQEVMPDLRFERRREQLQIVVLIDDDAAALAWNPIPREVIGGLTERGLEARVIRFIGTLKKLHGNRDDTIALTSLEEEKDRLLVLVVSDGQGLSLDDEEVLDRLASFPRVAWLDPRETRFWGERTDFIEGLDIPVFPASRQGVAEAFDALLSPRGGKGSPYSVAERRRRGLLVRSREGLRATVEEILGEALPWAQSCAMIQPVTVALAQRLRERFYPALPEMAIGRLFALPGTKTSTSGLSFATPVLALLREGFPQLHASLKEVDVLKFILAEVFALRPQQDEARPGLALLGWTALYERVRLEVEPDDATHKLARLAGTPLGPAVRADLAMLARPWREGESGRSALVPLRLKPRTEAALKILDDLARRGSDADRKRQRLTKLEWGGLGVLSAALLLSLLPVARAIRERRDTAGSTFTLRDASRVASGSRPLPPVWLAVMWADGTRVEPADPDLEATRAEARTAEDATSLSLIGAGRQQLLPWQGRSDQEGEVEIAYSREADQLPCLEEQPLLGLSTQVCPEMDAGPPLAGQLELPSWQEKVGAAAPPRRLLSIGIELDSEPDSGAAFQPLRDALLASSSVDRLYRIDASQGLLDEALVEIVRQVSPWGGSAQVVWWATGGDTERARLEETMRSFASGGRLLGFAAEARLNAEGIREGSILTAAGRPSPREGVKLSADFEHELRLAGSLAMGQIIVHARELTMIDSELRTLSFYPTAGEELSVWSGAVLAKAAAQLAQDPQLSAQVAGFSRSQDLAAGIGLFRQRAAAVAERLITNLGIDRRRVTVLEGVNSDLSLLPGEEVVYLLTGTPGTPPPLPEERSFTILATSDSASGTTYSRDGEGGGSFSRLRALRRRLEAQGDNVLVLLAGGAVRVGAEAPEVTGRMEVERAIELMNLLDGAPTREDGDLLAALASPELDLVSALSEPVEEIFNRAQFGWLYPAGQSLGRLSRSRSVGLAWMSVRPGGLGVFSLAHVVPEILGVERAKLQVGYLRAQGAEIVVAMSHQELNDDLALLEALGAEGPDLIVGGGEPGRQVLVRDGRFVIKASAANGEAAVIQIRLRPNERPVIEPRIVSLPPAQAAADIDRVVLKWRDRSDQIFCEQEGKPATCLSETLARTQVPLDLTATALRSGENAFGNWVADQMLARFRQEQVQVAFFNAGALRLNRAFKAGDSFTRRDIEDLVAFDSSLEVLDVSGATLRQVIEHALALPEYSGGWLQVAGLAFRYDPGRPSKAEVFLIEEPESPNAERAIVARPLRDNETVRVATTDYLVDPAEGDQDGYTMLDHRQHSSESKWTSWRLAVVLEEALRAAPGGVIAPKIEGRICLRGATGPCLIEPPAMAAGE